jgi:O-antigen/teichoic acid export membrane protein
MTTGAIAARHGRSIVARIYANLGYLLGGKAAAGLISLGYMAMAARALGPASYGVLILLHGYTITIGGIVNFPGWHAVVRYGAMARAKDDTPRMMRLLRTVGIVEFAAGALAILCAVVLAPIIGPRLGWNQTALDFSEIYSLAVLASVRSTPAGLLQLLRRFDLLGIHNIVAPAIRLVGAAVALSLDAGLHGFLIAWLVAALAECGVLWAMGLVVARRAFGRHPLIAGVRGVGRENPGIWRFMMAANADVTFGELAGRVAPLTVGWILGPAAAGLYAVAQRVTVIFAQPAQILGQAAYAELARLAAGHARGAAIRHALLRCIAIAFAAALPVLALLLVFSVPILGLIAGKGFEGAAAVMLLLALARVIQLAGPPASSALVALGHPSASVAANIVSSVGMWPLLPLFMWKWGLSGAGAQAIIQSFAAMLLLSIFAWKATSPARVAA